MARPRVVIADDHKIVVEGLKKVLGADFEIVSTVEDGRALLQAVQHFHPDVIVADISMPGLNGIDAVRQLKKVHEELKVVFLTMHPDVTYAASAFDAGASGYVLKHSAPDELVTAIRAALQDQTYVTPLIAGKLLHFYEHRASKPVDTVTGLSARQREVLQLLAEGHSVKQIAVLLQVSPKTVEYHKYQMMETLGLTTLGELIRYAVQHGIVPPDPS